MDIVHHILKGFQGVMEVERCIFRVRISSFDLSIIALSFIRHP
jgi:hypothetical protein